MFTPDPISRAPGAARSRPWLSVAAAPLALAFFALQAGALSAQDTEGAATAPGTVCAGECAATDALDPWGPLGPLRVAERSPFFRLFLTPVSEPADLIEADEFRVDMGFAYSNIFELGSSRTHDILFDLERLTTSVAVRYGVNERVEVGLTLATQTNWGGFLDPFVQGLHRTFGFPNADRDKVPDGAYELRVTPFGEDRSLVAVPAGTLLEDPVLHGAYRLAGGARHRHVLTARASLKVPLGERAAGTGRADGLVELAFRRSWGPTHLHLHGGIVVLGVPDDLTPHVRPAAAIAGLGVERRLTPGVSLVGQLIGGTPYGRNFDAVELDGVPLNLVLGATGRVAHEWGWQVSFAEDLVPEGPSVDFTFDLQISRRW